MTANTILADHITAGTITATEIASGTITTGQLNFTPNTDSTASIRAVAAATSGTVAGIQMDASTFYIGTGTYNNSNTPFFVRGVDGGGGTAGDFSLGDKFKWDDSSSTLTIDGSVVIGSTAASTVVSGAASGATANQSDTATILGGNLTGTVSGTSAATVRADAVRAGTWKHATDNTKIDGGDNYANSITANSIAATAIDGHTITGATIQSAGSGNKIVIDSAGFHLQSNSTGQFKFENSSGTQKGAIFYSSADDSINVYSTVGQVVLQTTNASSDITFIPGSSAEVVVSGDLDVTGSLSKGDGDFLIDHPLDKLNKELRHGFVEAPRYDLIYRGTAVLSSGTVDVDIDTASNLTSGTFVALTQNPEVWVQNKTGWTALRGAVSGATLTITAQDNAATDTVAWLLIAERADDHIKAVAKTDSDGHLIPERDKVGAKAGQLRHP